MDVMQGRPYPLRLWSIPLSTIFPTRRRPPDHWSIVDNAQRSNCCRNL